MNHMNPFFRGASVIICAAAIVLNSSFLFARGPAGKETVNTTSMGEGEVNFNPLGLLQFGPMVDAGLRAGSSTYIDAHFRWSYAGVAYQAIESDGFEYDVSPLGGGVGIKVIHCIFLFPESPNCMYIGGLTEYTWGGSSYEGEDDTDQSWEHKWRGITLMFNMGYRWRFSRFFMQAGLFAGIHTQFFSEVKYEKTAFLDAKTEDESGTLFIGMLELSFGFEFNI